MAYRLLDSEEDEQPKSKGRYRLLEEEKASQDQIPQIARGVGQGSIDATSLVGLPLYPVERGIQKVLGLEDDPKKLTPGQQARFGMESDILERMQQPGYKPSFSDFMALSDEDIMPETRGASALAGIQETANQIPEGGATQEITRRGVRNVPFALLGWQVYSQALQADLAGYGAKSLVGAMGGGETAQTWADIIGSLGYGLGSALKAKPTAIPNIAEETGGLLSKAEMKGSQNALQKRIQELDSSMINNLEGKTAQLSEKTFSDFPTFEAQEINRDIVKTNQGAVLNKIAPEMTPEIAWTNVGEHVENSYQKEREAYKKLYEEAGKRARSIKHTPTESTDLAASLLKKIRNVDTTAPGYEAVAKALTTAMTDLGVSIENVGGQAKIITKPVTIDKLQDVAIRLGEIVNYENLTPSIKDLIKPLVSQLKQEIRTGLKKESPLGFIAFDKAEKAYAKTAERFGNDAIMKLRKTETPENLTNFFSSPSNYKRLKEVTDQNFLNIADRQIIEELAAKNTDTAKKELRHLEQYLGQSNKDLANNLIDLGDKLTAPGQKAILQQRILEDAQRAIVSGERPNLIMKSMQTPEGYNIVKQTLERTPKGKEVFKVMQKQFVQDLFQSVLDDSGKINWSKAANLVKDPQVKSVLRSIGGEDLINFFRSMEKYGTNIQNNFAKYGSQDRTLLNEVFKVATSPTKLLLTALGTAIGGPVTGATIAASSVLATEAFWRMLANPKAQGVIKALAKPESYNKNALLPLINQLNSAL
jgi:hypothetical protein